MSITKKYININIPPFISHILAFLSHLSFLFYLFHNSIFFSFSLLSNSIRMFVISLNIYSSPILGIVIAFAVEPASAQSKTWARSSHMFALPWVHRRKGMLPQPERNWDPVLPGSNSSLVCSPKYESRLFITNYQ